MRAVVIGQTAKFGCVGRYNEKRRGEVDRCQLRFTQCIERLRILRQNCVLPQPQIPCVFRGLLWIAVGAYAHCVLRIACQRRRRGCVCALRTAYCVSAAPPWVRMRIAYCVCPRRLGASRGATAYRLLRVRFADWARRAKPARRPTRLFISIVPTIAEPLTL